MYKKLATMETVKQYCTYSEEFLTQKSEGKRQNEQYLKCSTPRLYRQISNKRKQRRKMGKRRECERKLTKESKNPDTTI